MQAERPLVVGMDCFPLRRFATGTEEYLEGLLTALLDRGVPCLALGGVPLQAEAPHLGQPERPRPTPWAKWRWESTGLANACRWSPVSVVHIPYLAHPPKSLQVPTLVTIHDVIPFTFPGYRGRMRDQLYFRALPARLRHASRFVAVSEATRAAVEGVFPEWSARVTVIPNGVDPAFYAPVEPTARDEAERLVAPLARDRDPIVLYVGGYQAHKNVPMLVEAFKRVPRDLGAHLVLVGADQEAALAARIEAAGLTDRVRRLPRVSRSVLRALYDAAAVFAYPSEVEGFGLPPAQALAARVPTAVSDAAAVVEVVGDAARVAPAHDAEAWGSSLTALLTLSPGERDQWARAGARRAEHYHWAAVAAQYDALYREVAGV